MVIPAVLMVLLQSSLHKYNDLYREPSVLKWWLTGYMMRCLFFNLIWLYYSYFDHLTLNHCVLPFPPLKPDLLFHIFNSKGCTRKTPLIQKNPCSQDKNRVILLPGGIKCCDSFHRNVFWAWNTAFYGPKMIYVTFKRGLPKNGQPFLANKRHPISTPFAMEEDFAQRHWND